MIDRSERVVAVERHLRKQQQNLQLSKSSTSSLLQQPENQQHQSICCFDIKNLIYGCHRIIMQLSLSQLWTMIVVILMTPTTIIKTTIMSMISYNYKISSLSFVPVDDYSCHRRHRYQNYHYFPKGHRSIICCVWMTMLLTITTMIPTGLVIAAAQSTTTTTKLTTSRQQQGAEQSIIVNITSKVEKTNEVDNSNTNITITTMTISMMSPSYRKNNNKHHTTTITSTKNMNDNNKETKLKENTKNDYNDIVLKGKNTIRNNNEYYYYNRHNAIYKAITQHDNNKKPIIHDNNNDMIVVGPNNNNGLMMKRSRKLQPKKDDKKKRDDKEKDDDDDDDHTDDDDDDNDKIREAGRPQDNMRYPDNKPTRRPAIRSKPKTNIPTIKRNGWIPDNGYINSVTTLAPATSRPSTISFEEYWNNHVANILENLSNETYNNDDNDIVPSNTTIINNPSPSQRQPNSPPMPTPTTQPPRHRSPIIITTTRPTNNNKNITIESPSQDTKLFDTMMINTTIIPLQSFQIQFNHPISEYDVRIALTDYLTITMMIDNNNNNNKSNNDIQLVGTPTNRTSTLFHYSGNLTIIRQDKNLTITTIPNQKSSTLTSSDSSSVQNDIWIMKQKLALQDDIALLEALNQQLLLRPHHHDFIPTSTSNNTSGSSNNFITIIQDVQIYFDNMTDIMSNHMNSNNYSHTTTGKENNGNNPMNDATESAKSENTTIQVNYVNNDTMTNVSSHNNSDNKVANVNSKDSMKLSWFDDSSNDSQMIWIWITCGIIVLFIFLTITFICWFYFYYYRRWKLLVQQQVQNMNSPTTTKTSSGANNSPFNHYNKIKPFIVDNEGNSTDHHHDDDINDELTIVGIENRLIDSSSYQFYEAKKNEFDSNRRHNEYEDDCTLKSYVTPPSTSSIKKPSFGLYSGWKTATTNNAMPRSSSSASILSLRSNNNTNKGGNSITHCSVGGSSNNYNQRKIHNSSLIGDKNDLLLDNNDNNNNKNKENDVISITSNQNVNWESILIKSYNGDDNNSHYDSGISNSSTHRSSRTTTGISSNSNSNNVSYDTSLDEVVFVHDNDLDQIHHHNDNIKTIIKVNEGDDNVSMLESIYSV